MQWSLLHDSASHFTLIHHLPSQLVWKGRLSHDLPVVDPLDRCNDHCYMILHPISTKRDLLDLSPTSQVQMICQKLWSCVLFRSVEPERETTRRRQQKTLPLLVRVHNFSPKQTAPWHYAGISICLFSDAKDGYSLREHTLKRALPWQGCPGWS